MQKGIIKNVNKLTGEPIDAKDLASMLSGIIGNESGVLTVFDELRLEKISDNKVRLHSGVYSLKGHILYIPKGSYEDFTIDSGTLGANRIDLLVAEYVRNGEGDGEDTLQFKVIKGESTSGSSQSPNLIQQDINENGLTHQEALYTLRLIGTSLNITKNYQKHFSLQGQTKQLEQAIKNQEDRIEEFSRHTLQTNIPNTNVRWGKVKATPSNSGYVPLRMERRFDADKTIVLSGMDFYANRKFTVNGYVTSADPSLVEFWVHDENGSPVTKELTIQYIMIYP